MLFSHRPGLKTKESTLRDRVPKKVNGAKTHATILQQYEAGGSETNMKDRKRDVLRKTILGLVKKGHVHYTDIERKTVATCLRFATSNTVRKQFCHYLLPNGYVERVGRGIYKISARYILAKSQHKYISSL